MQQTPPSVIIDTGHFSQSRMNEALLRLARGSGRFYAKTAVLCIGSDKITGDSYGPLTGQLLLRSGVPASAVVGSLEKPVHALTLDGALEQLQADGAFVIAVDACVGDPCHVGCVLMGPGPLHPGGGLGKTLPQAGDVAVSGVAAPDGDAFHNLQNAPLGLVYRMAEATAEAVCYVLRARAQLRAAEPSAGARLIRSGARPGLLGRDAAAGAEARRTGPDSGRGQPS